MPGGLLRFRHGLFDERLVSAMLTTLLATSTGLRALESVIGLILWILIMVWIYNIAKRKGRHALGWLILGFFFSLITLIIVALLPSKRTTGSYERR